MDIKTLKDRVYKDFISSFDNAITPLKKSFFEQISNSLAATFQLIYIFIDRVFSDSFLTTCTESRVLSYFAPLKNVIRKEPTVALGVAKFTGVETTVIPIGTLFIFNELEYKTLDVGTITTGFADINCESVEKGSVNNTLSNTSFVLSVPIIGIDNSVLSVLGFSGAVDQETIESLRTRTKQKFASPTNIDNDNFYKSLANELSNVKATFISSVKNGAGTFGVTILTFSNNGVPIQSDIDEVEQHFIDTESVPEYVEAEYFLPTITLQAFDIQLAIDDSINRALVSQALRDYMYLNQKPATTFKFDAVADFLQTLGGRLITPIPTSGVLLADDEILDLGVITWI